MEILLVMRDRLVRDQIKVGLQQFSEFSVTWGEGYAALNELRQQRYDAVFLGLPARLREAHHLLDHLRSFDRTTPLVVVVSDKIARDIAADKARFNISSVVSTPLDVADFFRLVARIRERNKQEGDAQGRATAKHTGVGVRG